MKIHHHLGEYLLELFPKHLTAKQIQDDSCFSAANNCSKSFHLSGSQDPSVHVKNLTFRKLDAGKSPKSCRDVFFSKTSILGYWM